MGGFRDGGPADMLAPGPELAALLKAAAGTAAGDGAALGTLTEQEVLRSANWSAISTVNAGLRPGNRNWLQDEDDGGRVPDESPAEICRSGRGHRVRVRPIGSCSCPKSAALGPRDRLAIPAAELRACNPCG
jgi:hypothetical protein